MSRLIESGKYRDLYPQWVQLYENGLSFAEIARQTAYKVPDIQFKSLENAIRRRLNKHYLDKEIVFENVKLGKQKQKYQDLNRIERKSFREHARIENAVEAYNSKLVEILEKGVDFAPNYKDLTTSESKIIVQLSDLHLNELIELPGNTFDFSVASKRLFKFAHKIKSIAKWSSANSIIVVFGGDLLNSDRRLDELLNMATNRAKATSLAFILIRYFLLDLAKDNKVSCVGVTGNESRAKQDLGWSDI